MPGAGPSARAVAPSGESCGPAVSEDGERKVCRIGIFRTESLRRSPAMRSFTAVIERDTETGLLVGHVPGFRGAHSQGETMEELQTNLAEVVAMLLEDSEPHLEAEFVGTQTVRVA